MRRWPIALAFALGIGAAGAQDQRADPGIEHWEADGLRRVWTHINHRDCAGAVNELNAGLARRYAAVMVMAGAMYEEGVCLKRDPQRALQMFERAYAAGRPQQAAGRMTALYAAPGALHDKAAALWWAQRGGQNVARLCVGAPVPADDADAFVKALVDLPAPLLEACNYVAGVLGVIQGDAEFPSRAAGFGMTGTVQLVFLPAQGRFEVTGKEIGAIQLGGVVNGDAVRDDRALVRNEFVEYMGELTRRALQRFERPGGVPEQWRFQLVYSFSY